MNGAVVVRAYGDGGSYALAVNGVTTPNVKNRTIENFYYSLRAAKA
jgi:hypothetical protein